MYPIRVQQAQEEAGALWAEPPGVRSGDDARPPTGKRRNDCSQRHGAGESGGGSPAAWGQRWGGNLNGQLQMESRSLSAGVGRAEPPSDGCAGTGPGKGGCPPDSEHGATRHLTAAGGDFGPPPPPCTRAVGSEHVTWNHAPRISHRVRMPQLQPSTQHHSLSEKCKSKPP